MLPLDSPRWKEFRHGSYENIPDIIRAIAAEKEPSRSSDLPKKERKQVSIPSFWADVNALLGNKEYEETAWEKVWSSLCHQYSIYPATYAAVPHMVSMAESGSIEKKLEVFLFLGVVVAFGKLENGPVPEDLIEPYDSAIETMKRMSMDIIRDAVSRNLLEHYPLNYLIQAQLALRFGACETICFLDRINEYFDVECPRCGSGIILDLTNILSESLDENKRAQDLDEGLKLVREIPEEEWPSESIVQIGAALASTFGDEELAGVILNLRATVQCESCGEKFQIEKGLL